MELDLDDSQQSFKSSENALSSSVSGKITIKNTVKQKEQKNQTQISKKEKGNLSKPIQPKNKLPQVNIENISMRLIYKKFGIISLKCFE